MSSHFARQPVFRATVDGASAASIVSALSGREKEVFGLISTGAATKDIAADLGISGKTVDTHRLHMMEKLGLRGMAELRKCATDWTSLEE